MDTHGAGTHAGSAVRQATDSVWFERAARIGFVVSGLLHLLIAWLALRVAWWSPGTKADQSGALAMLRERSWGVVVLWICVVGFAALALWQLTDAILGQHGSDAKERTGARLKAAAKAGVYAVLAYTSLRFALGSGQSSSKQTRDFTRQLMSHSGGRALVIAIGLVVLGVAAYHVYKGWTRGFRRDLVEHPGTTVEYLGVVGYIAKGIALAIVGVLFCLAGFQKKASEASGLDGALKTLREQPFGPYLLTLVALGLAAYGLYSFWRAKLARL
jgi:hypothetical protein